MAIERFYSQIDAVSFTADGQDIGLVTVTSTRCFKVKMFVVVNADGMEPQRFQVKRVISETQMFLGPENSPIRKRSDMSIYTLSDNPTVEAPEQERPEIPPADYERASYEEEPTVAKRSFLVDKQGSGYTVKNPFPVQLTDGSVNIGSVNADLEVQLSHKDNTPNQGDVADSVQVGDEATIAKVDPQNRSWSMNRYEKLLPLLTNAKWLELINYEEITTEFSGDVATLSYIEGGNVIAKAIFTFATDSDWSFKLESYINDDDGDTLLDDDGTPLFLD